jgi:hypothetical protein
MIEALKRGIIKFENIELRGAKLALNYLRRTKETSLAGANIVDGYIAEISVCILLNRIPIPNVITLLICIPL